MSGCPGQKVALGRLADHSENPDGMCPTFNQNFGLAVAHTAQEVARFAREPAQAVRLQVSGFDAAALFVR
jgi:hypothetical protein